MSSEDLQIVTGAFGYTGKYIARRLLAMGKRVKTLTGHPDRANPFGEKVSAVPFNFERPDELARSLEGATTLYNTYWIRFARAELTFEKAVENSITLINAAQRAGVRSIVHTSITNPSEDSPLPYFRGKALVERAIVESGLSYAILRPSVLYGPEDILINNIAWLLRRFPVFPVFGPGDYRLQPIFVDDFAEMAVSADEWDENVLRDAVGPEIYTFEELLRLIADAIGTRARLVHVSPKLAFFLASLVGRVVADVMITRDEIEGLMADLLVSADPPTAPTRLSDWVRENAATLGDTYASELRRHYR